MIYNSPSVLPDRSVRREVGLVPGAIHYVTRQYMFSRERRNVVDDFFCANQEGGMVRETNFSHSTPIKCI